MPLVQQQQQALSLSTSSPSSAGKKTIAGSVAAGCLNLDVPIELENNCSEDGITIESDDVGLTNGIRKHYLEHFGHRDLAGIVSDYAPEAILLQVVNGKERTKYHGHDELRQYFADQVFAKHPAGESSFRLEHITVEQRHAMVIWSGKTPTTVIVQASDTLVFNGDGKIVKQFLACQTNPREDPGTGRVVRKDPNGKDYGAFFEG
jgi:hypothetical protein